MDPLSDIIALLRPSTAVSKPITGRGSWCVRYAAHDQPGFTIILIGRCWVAFDGQEPLRLAEGDFLLLPRTPGFTLYSDPEAACVPREPQSVAVRHGEQEGDPDFVSLGGSFKIDLANAPLLLALLPDIIHIRSSEGRASRLGRLIELIADECASDHPGKDMILERLLEILLVESLRWRSIAADQGSAGLLAGMRDPAIARALRAMHADVRARWTVSKLARVAGLSRSVFSARFAEWLGCGPIEYLTRWRMAVAQDALGRSEKSLAQIADVIGYESASAFSTAFKKRFGRSPGKFARKRREAAAHERSIEPL